MSKAGSRILTSARQALAYAKGETTDGFAVHVPERADAARSNPASACRKTASRPHRRARRHSPPGGTGPPLTQGSARVLLALIDKRPSAEDILGS